MTNSSKHNSPTWYVYLVRTATGMLYTGISTDAVRRLSEHESGIRGARILRGKGPLQLVFQIEAGTRSSASILEARIKKLSRKQKLELVSGKVECSDITGWFPVVMQAPPL